MNKECFETRLRDETEMREIRRLLRQSVAPAFHEAGRDQDYDPREKAVRIILADPQLTKAAARRVVEEIRWLDFPPSSRR